MRTFLESLAIGLSVGSIIGIVVIVILCRKILLFLASMDFDIDAITEREPERKTTNEIR